MTSFCTAYRYIYISIYKYAVDTYNTYVYLMRCACGSLVEIRLAYSVKYVRSLSHGGNASLVDHCNGLDGPFISMRAISKFLNKRFQSY